MFPPIYPHALWHSTHHFYFSICFGPQKDHPCAFLYKIFQIKLKVRTIINTFLLSSTLYTCIYLCQYWEAYAWRFICCYRTTDWFDICQSKNSSTILINIGFKKFPKFAYIIDRNYGLREFSVSLVGTTLEIITEIVRRFITSNYITVVPLFNVRMVAAQLKMSDIVECTNIQFCVLLQKSPAETLTILWKAYGDRAM